MDQAEIFAEVSAKIVGDDARLAFFELLVRLNNDTSLTMRPYRHGYQRGIHLLFDPDGPVTGNLANGAQFAFDGAAQHLRWWFRPPCLKYLLLSPNEIADVFEHSQTRADDHSSVELCSKRDVDLLMPLLQRAEARFREI